MPLCTCSYYILELNTEVTAFRIPLETDFASAGTGWASGVINEFN